MIEAALFFARWLAARVRTGRPVRVSIRDAYVLYVAWSCLAGMLVFGAVVFGIERGAGTPRTFIDCLFHVASAVSSTGLITLDTSTLQAGSNVVIFLSMLVFANTLLITQVPVVLRILRVRASRAAAGARRTALDTARAALAAPPHALDAATLDAAPERSPAFGLVISEVAAGNASTLRMAPRQVGAAPAAARTLSSVFAGSPTKRSPTKRGGTQFLQTDAVVRACAASGMSPATAALLDQYRDARAEDARLSGALESFLAGPDFLGYHWCLALGVGYYALIVLSGFVCICAWGAASASARALLASNGNVSLPWFSAYHVVSLFTNTGLMLITDNMIQFGRDKFFVVTSGVIASLGFSF
jgi:hypothetical protein